MTESQVAELLTLCSSFDDRDVSLSATMSWHPILEPYDFDDACDAIRAHYTRTRDRIMPVDVLNGIKQLRALRLARTEDPPPDADPNDPTAYIAALRAGRRRIADGELPQRPVQALIAGNPIGQLPPVDYAGPEASRRRKQAAMLAIEASKEAAVEQRRIEREEAEQEQAHLEAARRELEPLRDDAAKASQ